MNFEVGQKWKTDDKHVVTVVYKNDRAVVVACEDKRLVSFSLEGAMEYFAEQVTEPKYRPFEGGEFAPKHSVVPKEIESMRAGWFSDTHVWVGNYYTWEDAFEKFTFEDGSPFGVKIE